MISRKPNRVSRVRIVTKTKTHIQKEKCKLFSIIGEAKSPQNKRFSPFRNDYCLKLKSLQWKNRIVRNFEENVGSWRIVPRQFQRIRNFPSIQKQKPKFFLKFSIPYFTGKWRKFRLKNYPFSLIFLSLLNKKKFNLSLFLIAKTLWKPPNDGLNPSSYTIDRPPCYRTYR